MKASFSKIAAAAAVAIVLTMAVAGTARADDRDWRMHEAHARRWHAHPMMVPEVVPVYSPPVVVAAPPPPSPGLSLILPINIR